MELTAQRDRILLLDLCILLLLMISMWFRGWALEIFIRMYLMFIIGSVISFIRWWFTVGMRLLGSGGIGFGRTYGASL